MDKTEPSFIRHIIINRRRRQLKRYQHHLHNHHHSISCLEAKNMIANMNNSSSNTLLTISIPFGL